MLYTFPIQVYFLWNFFFACITLKLSLLLEILANVHNLSGLTYHASTKKKEIFTNLLYTVSCNKLGTLTLEVVGLLATWSDSRA